MPRALPVALLLGGLVVGALALSGGYFLATSGEPRYRGGWVEATAVSEAPPNVTVVDVTDSTVAESERLVRTIRNATRTGNASTSLPTERSYRSLAAALPGASRYAGSDYEPGYYVRYDGRIVRIEVFQLL